MLEKLKMVAKGAMALLSIALVVMIATKILDDLYDFRLLLAAAGGAFGFQPLVKLFNKIKALNQPES